MHQWAIVSLVVALSSGLVAHAQSRGVVTMTVTGAGAGFGVGLWLGLSAFDDAVNSDRKVWTSAIAGAGAGAVAGYLIGRARSERPCPSPATGTILRERRESTDPRLLEQLAKTIQFDRYLLPRDSRLRRSFMRQSTTTP